MVDTPGAGFGTGSVYSYPPELLNALFQYANAGPNTALQLALAQYGAQQSQAQHPYFDPAVAATIGANAGIQQQGIQTGGAVNIANANNAAMLLAAAGGDKNAAARLQAQLALEAAQANQQQYGKLIDAATSTGLRDQLFARNFIRGGSQPAFGSALGVIGQPSWITAPNVGYSEYGAAPVAQAPKMPSLAPVPAGGPIWSTPGGSSGGDIGALYQSLLGMTQGAFGGFSSNYPTQPYAGVLPGTNPMGGSNPATTANTAFADRIFGSPTTPGRLASGGSAKEGYSWVGEQGPELMHKKGNVTEIIPMHKIGGYATGTYGVSPTGSEGNYGGSVSPPTGAPRFVTPKTVTQPAGYWPVSAPAAISGGQVSTMPVGDTKTETVPGSTTPDVSFKFDAQGNPILKVGASSNGGLPMAPSITPDMLAYKAAHPGDRDYSAYTPGWNSGINPSGGAMLPGTQPNATQTGNDIVGLPAYQAMFGNGPSGYNATQKYDLPEYGLSNLPGPAMLARLLNPATSTLNDQERNDIITLLNAGGYSNPAIQDIQQRFTPGFRNTAARIGF